MGILILIIRETGHIWWQSFHCNFAVLEHFVVTLKLPKYSLYKSEKLRKKNFFTLWKMPDQELATAAECLTRIKCHLMKGAVINSDILS